MFSPEETSERNQVAFLNASRVPERSFFTIGRIECNFRGKTTIPARRQYAAWCILRHTCTSNDQCLNDVIQKEKKGANAKTPRRGGAKIRSEGYPLLCVFASLRLCVRNLQRNHNPKTACQNYFRTQPSRRIRSCHSFGFTLTSDSS